MASRVEPWQAELSAGLRERADQSLYRRRRVLGGGQGVHVEVDGRRCVNFCSNDYLGLAVDPGVIAAARAALEEEGVGGRAARLP